METNFAHLVKSFQGAAVQNRTLRKSAERCQQAQIHAKWHGENATISTRRKLRRRCRQGRRLAIATSRQLQRFQALV